MEPIKASETFVQMTQVVLPNDTNTLSNLRGGRVLHWMDLAAAVSAQKHSKRVCVTASVDSVSFDNPIKLGDVVTMQSKVTRSFNSSMEIFIEVWTENIPGRRKVKSNEAYYTFVALDDMDNPIKVPELIPETEDEKKRFDSALRRRQLRLILAGKLQPSDATELKALFMEDK